MKRMLMNLNLNKKKERKNYLILFPKIKKINIAKVKLKDRKFTKEQILN